VRAAEVLERECTDRLGEADLLLVGVTLKVAFDLVSSTDGSSHTVETFGEALDASDKATAKAMSSAYKHAMLQAFCVPVTQIEDADASSHRLKRNRSHQREPVEGWAMWTCGIVDIIESCATIEAVERMRERQRPLLTAISREKPDLYTLIGAAFAKRTADLNGERCAMSEGHADGEGCADCEKEVARTEPLLPKPERRSRGRGTAAERPNGEGCAERKARRSSKPARSHPRNQTQDVSATAPEPT
jgi:hypothetical protein